MRIYMDTCSLKRPFDDQTQDRIYFESEAISAILAKCDRGEWLLLTSKILDYELNNDPDPIRKKYMLTMFGNHNNFCPITDDLQSRANEFQKHGVKSCDSLHLASAEFLQADVLLTTDDNFLKAAQRTDAEVKIANPLSMLEVLLL